MNVWMRRNYRKVGSKKEKGPGAAGNGDRRENESTRKGPGKSEKKRKGEKYRTARSHHLKKTQKRRLGRREGKKREQEEGLELR